MSTLALLDTVPQEEVITKLLEFYSRVEQVLSSRLPHEIWQNQERQQGAKEVLDILLRGLVEKDLQKLLPGVGIHWDYQVRIPPVYSTSSVALVDLVDGAKEYARLGANVTSHLGVYKREGNREGNRGGKKEGEELGELQLGIVSYPFHRFRVISVGQGAGSAVYYVPFDTDIMDGDISTKMERGRLAPSVQEKKLEDLNIVDRYKYYGAGDVRRQKLDGLREKLYAGKGRYSDLEGGSIAKNIIDVALGAADVLIIKHPPRAYKGCPPIEYRTPSTILRNLGGVFTDLEGNVPTGNESITGFIAAANQQIYDLFREYLQK